MTNATSLALLLMFHWLHSTYTVCSSWKNGGLTKVAKIGNNAILNHNLAHRDIFGYR